MPTTEQLTLTQLPPLGTALAGGIFVGVVTQPDGAHVAVALLPDHVRQDTPLRPVESLVISPRQRIDDIAPRHLENLPTPVRALLRGVGVGGVGPDARGAALASYLLFEAPFTRELMALGEADTMARADEVHQFFAWPAVRVPRRPAVPGAPEAATAAAYSGDDTQPLPVITAPPDIVLP